MSIDEPVRGFEWQGDFEILTFDVEVDRKAAKGVILLKFDVYIDHIRIAALRTELEIGGTVRPGEKRTLGLSPAQSAYASYSREDELRVLERVAAVRTSAGLDVFVDRLSLKPGEKWKERLRGEIIRRDLFLLFWSHHARDSRLVEWEWNTALDNKAENALQLHPLEPVRDAPPPERLAHLHFDDPLMLIRLAREESD